jgi:hypothetical protein
LTAANPPSGHEHLFTSDKEESVLRTSLLIFALLTSGTLLLGQEARSNTNPSLNSGCLRYDARGYHLIDSSGQAVTLRFQANQLQHYVGQQVSITGRMGFEAIDTTVDGLASSVEELPVLEVVEVKSAGGACSIQPTQ